jgi:hypothetical protein
MTLDAALLKERPDFGFKEVRSRVLAYGESEEEPEHCSEF